MNGRALLLDTHVWLWMLLEPDRLSEGARVALEDGDNELWLSPISVWEALLLAQRGRLTLDEQPEPWIDRALRATPIRDAPLTREVAIRSRLIELPHDDPADRFIAASAAVHDLTLMTADRRLSSSRDYAVLPG